MDTDEKPKAGDVAPGAKFKGMNGCDDFKVYEGGDASSPFFGLTITIERWNGTALTTIKIEHDGLPGSQPRALELRKFIIEFFGTAPVVQCSNYSDATVGAPVVHAYGKKAPIEAKIVKALSGWAMLDQYRKGKEARDREREQASITSSFTEGPVAKVLTFPGAREIYTPDGDPVARELAGIAGVKSDHVSIDDPWSTNK